MNRAHATQPPPWCPYCGKRLPGHRPDCPTLPRCHATTSPPA
ncbi:hypothetical protein NOGI109294_15390 [Nocardiopsis gilva]|nr:hypothetical protein [Nocardiopsis gilva]